MALFVFTTTRCREMATHYSLTVELDRFRDRVQRSQTYTGQFDPFPPPYLVKKKFGGQQGRLIAELRAVGEHDVIVFLDVMIRGDKAYENGFAKDPVAYGNQHFHELYSYEALEEFVRRCTQDPEQPMKPKPSEDEFGLLYGAFAHHEGESNEVMVYETTEWKEAVSEERVANQLLRLYKPCLDALSLEPGIHRVPVQDKPKWAVYVHRSPKSLLLLLPVTESNVASAEKIVDYYRKNLADEKTSLNEVLRLSRRAYPAYMLGDDDTWVDIEKEPVANLALSPEESEVLQSARHAEGGFPLFVNGRAGSGKSTILQYLFADLLFHYLQTSSNRLAPPVYLTASGDLLRVARGFVERMIRNEASFRLHGVLAILENSREILDESFLELRPYLLSLIQPAERATRFAASKRVDYTRFRTLWKDWFGMDPQAEKTFGPDLSWHVVRGYIKGMLSECFMDPADYEQLPENQRTVTRETFKMVFSKVWEGRYAKLSDAEGLWDDQDLARYVIEHELVQPTYPAVLCDEAQDFTRIELELLLRMNLFSGRAVPPHDLGRVPFAFAGDQFQTLNPTGFRWDAIKASFVEKFIRALDPTGRSGRVDLNYKELNYNYRSTPPIVRFSNGVQALRAALFNLPELKPQTPWAVSQNVYPVAWFNEENVDFWRRFKDVADAFVVIVPCSEGEEARYVRADSILSQQVRFENEVPQNVLSAARAKGTEYEYVVVYGFGEAAPVSPLKWLADTTEKKDDVEGKTLPLQYFINRLYVAVSRAKQRIIIVDSQHGFEKLWDFARQEEVMRRIVKVANRGREVWSIEPGTVDAPAVDGMMEGNVDDLTRGSAIDPIENARVFEQDGLARSDSYMFKQAASLYRIAGNTAKASECRARALELEGSFLEAGEAFESAGFRIPETVRCYFRAKEKGWRCLIDLGKKHNEVAREIEFKFARASIEKTVKPTDGLKMLEELAARLATVEFAEYVAKGSAWQDTVNTLISLLLKVDDETTAKKLERVLERFEEQNVAQPDQRMAEIHFRAGSLEKAARRWERAGETYSATYLKVKAAIEPYPNKLTSLVAAGSFDDAIREYEGHPGQIIDPVHMVAVATAYSQNEQFDAAIKVAWTARNAPTLRQIALDALARRAVNFAAAALSSTVFLMVEGGEWDALVTLATKQQEFLSDYPNWGSNDARELVIKNAEDLKYTLVRGLARSESFPTLPGHRLRPLREFLTNFLRVKEGRWRDYITVEEAGAAFERAGRFSDALSFYEAVRDSSFSNDAKRFARLRWIMCKARQLEYERLQVGPNHLSSGRIQNIKRDLDNAAAGVDPEVIRNLPVFPLLESIAQPLGNLMIGSSTSFPETPSLRPQASTEQDVATAGSVVTKPTELPPRVRVTIGEFIVEMSRQVGRCNITHEHTLQTAFLNLHSREPGGEIAWRTISPTEWLFEAWGVRATLVDSTVLLAVDGQGVRLSFDGVL